MTTFPKKALVLAAGFGTRMLPLTRTVPKPMLPIWGVPALDHVLRLLQRWGVRDVLINLHHLPHVIYRHVLASSWPDLRIQFSFEAEILGTGGAVRKAEWFFADRQPFWMVNADVIADVDPRPLLRAFHPRHMMAAVWLHDQAGPRTVEMRRARVSNWQSASPGRPGTYTFCGVQLLSPEILDLRRGFLPRAGAASIITAYARAMRAGYAIAGVLIPGSYWADVGTPAQYLDAHRDILRRYQQGLPGGQLMQPDLLRRVVQLRKNAVTVSGFVALGSDVAIGRGAFLQDSVLHHGVRVARGARITKAIVAPGAQVSGTVPYLALRAAAALDAAECAFVAAQGWPVAETTALPLGPRGSARVFTRLRAGRRSAILVHYKPEREENTLYAGHARFLRSIGVRVPEVLADDPRRCLSLFEDLGDSCVQDLLPDLTEIQARRLYERILEGVLVFHERGAAEARRRKLSLVPPFRAKLYRWEHDLFAEHMLEKRLRTPAPRVAAIRKDLWRAASHLLKARAVLVHRDLQSSNLLRYRGEIVFIDFQGMRYGPAAYDLASLFCDPYVNLPAGLREHLLFYYAARCPDGARLLQDFWPAAIQRLAQALGAYGRLSEHPDTSFFARYIPPAVAMMRHALQHFPKLPALAAWCEERTAP